jgi:23S rRNA (cytidine1920-2'-O)/16S rRNA (cytidine1409-2'-O)-methyltransferase
VTVAQLDPPAEPLTEGPAGVRADKELVQRGLARSRGQAAELIRAGRVRADGEALAKPSVVITEETRLEVEPAPHDDDVGRGAEKLRGALADLADAVDLADSADVGDSADVKDDAALDATADAKADARVGPAVRGRRCLDVGASTGGFTQVLLEMGARSVTALDVGQGQLAAVVAQDPRVQERSRTNVREVQAAELGGTFDLLVADLSFISLTLVMPHLAALVHPGADLLLLVKPQFEIGRERLGSDGVVRSTQQQAESVAAVRRSAENEGLVVRRVVTSRRTGASGNIEFFLWASR